MILLATSWFVKLLIILAWIVGIVVALLLLLLIFFEIKILWDSNFRFLTKRGAKALEAEMGAWDSNLRAHNREELSYKTAFIALRGESGLGAKGLYRKSIDTGLIASHIILCRQPNTGVEYKIIVPRWSKAANMIEAYFPKPTKLFH